MTKRLLFMIALIISTTQLWAQTEAILEAEGWLESAFVKWTPIEGADSYHVYYSGEGITDKKIDTQLIRNYGDYYRADVLGLKAGNYSLKIVPVTNDVEGTAIETSPLTVKAHDRSGFAFANGRVPGAYKADGTPKDQAVILYITQNTKNTTSMDVTGATVNPCVGLQTILDGFKKGKDVRPLIIRFIGQITDLSYMLNGDIVVENNNNASSYITFEGVGDDAVFDGWGLRIKSASNVEVRNVGTMNCDSGEGDNIGLQQANDYIWVHNCDFFYGHAGGDSDQAKGDGALDCKKSTYVTFSYNHFWDSGKSNLLGLSEGTTTGLYITYHHNWYDHSDSRHPRVRFYSAHVYNNYYDGNAKYGVGSTKGSSVYVEKNYFRNCKNPMMISMQGTDTKMGTDLKDSPTFSKEDGGIIKAFENVMVENFTFAPYSAENPIEFDAYVATSREEKVPATVTSRQGGNQYNNFDTDPTVIYSYEVQDATTAMNQVKQYAGRVKGGDFKWTFDNAVDDASYALNTALKNALTSYKTTLVAVQGDGAGSGSDSGDGAGDGSGDGSGDNNNPGSGVIEGDIFHNFTESGKDSKVFSITGNMNSTPGAVSYNGLALTARLKIESSTNITFTTTEAATLTLVLDADFVKRVKIDDVYYTAVNGIVTAEIAAGTHTITKGDTANLYLISLKLDAATGISDAAVSAVKLYPNPVADRLRIATEAKILQVEIFTLSGMNVLSLNGVEDSIEVAHLNAGIYLIRITTDEGMIQERIMKR